MLQWQLHPASPASRWCEISHFQWTAWFPLLHPGGCWQTVCRCSFSLIHSSPIIIATIHPLSVITYPAVMLAVGSLHAIRVKVGHTQDRLPLHWLNSSMAVVVSPLVNPISLSVTICCCSAAPSPAVKYQRCLLVHNQFETTVSQFGQQSWKEFGVFASPFGNVIRQRFKRRVYSTIS